MDDERQPPEPAPKRSPYDGLFSEVITYFSPVEIGLGAGAAVWAATTDRVLEQEATVLLGVAAAGIGLLAVALTAMTFVIAFLEGFFGKTVRRLGVRRFFRPFVVVAVVSASAAVVGFAGALDSGTGPEWVQDVLFGLAAWLIVWAIAGSVRLVFTLVTYADRRATFEGIPTRNSRRA